LNSKKNTKESKKKDSKNKFVKNLRGKEVKKKNCNDEEKEVFEFILNLKRKSDPAYGYT